MSQIGLYKVQLWRVSGNRGTWQTQFMINGSVDATILGSLLEQNHYKVRLLKSHLRPHHDLPTIVLDVDTKMTLGIPVRYKFIDRKAA